MQIVVADFAGVCTSSVCRILRRTSEAITSRRVQFIRMPQTQEEIHAARTAFWQIASMPHVIGAIDCTHIKIQSPGGDRAENFRNRKGWFSLNVQTIASANLKIISIVARWPGASHDQMIFNNSVIKMRLERGDFGDSTILGDSGYRNTNYLATRFLRCNTPEERLFNESQIRTQAVGCFAFKNVFVAISARNKQFTFFGRKIRRPLYLHLRNFCQHRRIPGSKFKLTCSLLGCKNSLLLAA